MKWVRILDGAVQEIIPEMATSPSIEVWYGKSFAEQCVQAPTYVWQGWLYDRESQSFTKPDYIGEEEV